MEQFTPNAINILSSSALGLVLMVACWTDYRHRRIPNKLIAFGIVIGFALQNLLPTGQGLFSPNAGSIGNANALCGFATGLGLFIPLYILRAMGAGDVKLIATIGIFLGPGAIVSTILMTFLAGGMLAIAAALFQGIVGKTIVNVQFIMTHTIMNAFSGHRIPIGSLSISKIKLPYALAITVGTIFNIALARSNHALFW